MRYLLVLAAAMLPFVALPSPVLAANGYTTGNVNMRAQPYVARHNRITTIPAGSRVTVYSCQRWCDVGWRGRRGWVSSRYVRVGAYRPRVRSRPPIIYFDYGRYHRHYDRRYYDKRRKYYRNRYHNRRYHDRRYQGQSFSCRNYGLCP